MASTKRLPDLTIVAPSDIRKIKLDASQINAGAITLLDALDMADAAGIVPTDFSAALTGKLSQATRARVLYALAWVYARRVEPGLTFAEICTYDLEVIGSPVSEQDTDRIAARAERVMSASRLTGLPPSEAQMLTLAQVDAAANAVKAINGRRRR